MVPEKNGTVPTPVYVYNPLPAALHHFERSLRSVLSSARIPLADCVAPSTEIAGLSGARRVRMALTELAAHLRADWRGGHVVVCWPTYGLLEPALWLPTSAATTVSIIVHDPSPLRRQVGMGRAASMVGRGAARAPRLRIVAHSEPAAARLVESGWRRPSVLPHPLLPRRVDPAAGGPGGGGTVLVCGQYKPARDLRLLAELGPALGRLGCRAVIAGRGWPDLPGWQVVDRFLSENELDRRMADSAAVLVPYSHFYQSGIAVRAMELGVPVVGPSHPFLVDLFGADWPGLVAGERVGDWASAVSEVAGRARDVPAAARRFRLRCEAEWAGYLAQG